MSQRSELVDHSKSELRVHINFDGFAVVEHPQYFGTTKYELSTPTLSRSTGSWYLILKLLVFALFTEYRGSTLRNTNYPVDPLKVGVES